MRLVKPNIVNASIHSLLKSLSSSYASEQLAARHCFPLEDPLDDKKCPTDAEGLVYVCQFCTNTIIVFLNSNVNFAELQLKQLNMKPKKMRIGKLKSRR